QTDLVGIDLRATGGPDGLLDALRKQGKIVLPDRPTLTGLPDAVDDLLAAERLGYARPLHHRQARRLDGGEAALTLGALPPPPDRGAVVGRTGVDDPRVAVPAERTVHGTSSTRPLR